MNRYEYYYMRKQAAINKLAMLYTAIKGILRVKVAGGVANRLHKAVRSEPGGVDFDKEFRIISQNPAELRQLAEAAKKPGNGFSPAQLELINHYAPAPIEFNRVFSPSEIGAAKADSAKLLAEMELEANGGGGGIGVLNVDKPECVRPALDKAKARVDAATAAQNNGIAEVPPSNPQPQPQPQPQAQPDKLGYGSMALRGGAAAGGALVGGGLGYGAARGLGLYNEDAGTGKRMLGHLLTAGGAIGGGIGGYYGGSALDKYLAARRAAK